MSALAPDARAKFDRVRRRIADLGSALVAYSGGIDSTLVLALAHEVLGERAVGMTAASASIPAEELEAARELAREIGVRHIVIDSHELENPEYAANPSNRCYFCKSELYTLCDQQLGQLGLSAALDGCNADDLADHRPGRRAATEHKVLSPLADEGVTKDEIRLLAREMGLRNWDKPPTPCLSSRLPYGTAVTPERLVQIGSAERDLRGLGFRLFRVRYHGEIARIEVDASEVHLMLDAQTREAAQHLLQARGFKWVVLDLEPFRSGRLNEGLKV